MADNFEGYARISLWMEAFGDDTPRAALPGAREFDVAIIGGGYTGLWTAYYLKTLAPEMSICVLEAHVCGFGASGRNGGWLMSALEGEDKLLSGLSSDMRQQALGYIHGIIPEVQQALQTHSIDCDFTQGGGLYAAARYPRQLRIQRDLLAELHGLGHTEDDYVWLDADQFESRLHINKPQGGIFTPHIARIHPAKLVRNLASAVENLGVHIFEKTRVLQLSHTSGAGVTLETDRGEVGAGVAVMAMEGFSYELVSQRRRVLPIQSRIIATEPLSEQYWQHIGLAQHEVFCDASPLVSYGQRTADNRLVFGSRGGYRFGGRPRSRFDRDVRAFEAVHKLLLDCLPQLRGVNISHRWGGTLGMPRNYTPHAVYDPVSNVATAGGYMGEGVGASNLMARTLADLILDRNTGLSDMPWAHKGNLNQVLRRWEPEPLRWLGYKAIDLSLGLKEWLYSRG